MLLLASTVIFSALIAISITLHELGHSYVAIKKGCRVRGITLAVFGGVANMESIPSKPMDEFLMAIAGPMVSLLLGISGIAFSMTLDVPDSFILNFIGIIIFYTGAINIMLAIFNLIPAFPMDGGRVLRALLTPKKGKVKATYIASRIGKAFAMIFGFIGLSQYFFDKEPLGLLKVIIAILIYTMAENEYKLVKMQDAAQWFGSNNDKNTNDSPFPHPPCRGVAESEDRPPDDNQAEVSPPPYENGPGTKSKIRNSNEDNPFTNIFGR